MIDSHMEQTAHMESTASIDLSEVSQNQLSVSSSGALIMNNLIKKLKQEQLEISNLSIVIAQSLGTVATQLLISSIKQVSETQVKKKYKNKKIKGLKDKWLNIFMGFFSLLIIIDIFLMIIMMREFMDHEYFPDTQIQIKILELVIISIILIQIILLNIGCFKKHSKQLQQLKDLSNKQKERVKKFWLTGSYSNLLISSVLGVFLLMFFLKFYFVKQSTAIIQKYPPLNIKGNCFYVKTEIHLNMYKNQL